MSQPSSALDACFPWKLFSGWSGDDAHAVFAKDGRNQTVSGFFPFPEALETAARHIAARFRESLEPCRVLVVGVANGQEPCSYLTLADAIARSSGGGTAIPHVIELHLMDVLERAQLRLYPRFGHAQSPLDGRQLERSPSDPPASVIASFVRTQSGWEVNEGIQHAFREAAHSKRAHWRHDICDGLIDQAGTYDVVSANRVLPYIAGRSARLVAVSRLAELVRVGGILVSAEGADGPMSDLFNVERIPALKGFVTAGNGVLRRER